MIYKYTPIEHSLKDTEDLLKSYKEKNKNIINQKKTTLLQKCILEYNRHNVKKLGRKLDGLKTVSEIIDKSNHSIDDHNCSLEHGNELLEALVKAANMDVQSKEALLNSKIEHLVTVENFLEFVDPKLLISEDDKINIENETSEKKEVYSWSLDSNFHINNIDKISTNFCDKLNSKASYKLDLSNSVSETSELLKLKHSLRSPKIVYSTVADDLYSDFYFELGKRQVFKKQLADNESTAAEKDFNITVCSKMLDIYEGVLPTAINKDNDSNTTEQLNTELA